MVLIFFRVKVVLKSLRIFFDQFLYMYMTHSCMTVAMSYFPYPLDTFPFLFPLVILYIYIWLVFAWHTSLSYYLRFINSIFLNKFPTLVALFYFNNIYSSINYWCLDIHFCLLRLLIQVCLIMNPIPPLLLLMMIIHL
jgi:hypothetical protein